ncbi:hypothetical protein KVT40_009040 [Elsinoe batatas]|uniref:Uncharacterized protein n=1 Tax=Elsinoe batatas TaxID=2601811 RepID=A0A8K0KUD6_9PEZI|nr:hypothetical protein KVT40_009040 [Elsinoe batatas]
MVEIAAFVRRRSARKSLSEDELLSPVETNETTATRSNSAIRRLTKSRYSETSGTQRSDSTSRPNRHSLVDLTRKSFDRRSFRREPNSPEGTYWSRPTGIVEEPLDFDTPDTPDNDTMSADLLKTVAKKTSLKNILCDKQGESEDGGIDIDAAILLLQELKKKASPEELVALHRALLPTKPGSTSTRPAQDAVVTPYSRRSSMLTPGIATRSKSPGKSPKDVTSSPSPALPQKAMKARPLSQQIAASASTKPGMLPRQASCMELPPHRGVPTLSRSYSPADLDISAIGGLQLGTLRITNGAVSPEPSIISEADDRPVMIKPSHSRSHSEPQPQVNWTVEEIADLREDSVTPRPTNPVARETTDMNRRSIIPGLDSYDDSSEDEIIPYTPKPQGTPFAENDYHNDIANAGPYRKPAFNVSVGSVISRLSTIEDNESLAERAQSPILIEERIQSPTFAFERLTGHALQQSPPPSSGSDSSSLYPATVQRLSPLHSNPRPAKPIKAHSGYASEIPLIRGRVSSDEESLDSIPMFPRPANYQLAKRSNCQLETIPSVSDILSVPSEAGDDDITTAELRDLSDPVKSPSVPAKDHLIPPPMQRNPASSSSSIPSVVSSDLDSQDTKSGDKTPKPRRKLYKPPPVNRNSSFEVISSPISPSLYPTVPDEMSVNFSRRICRAPGSFHPEHAFAAQAQMSRESLDRMEQAKDAPMSLKLPEAGKMTTPVKTALPSSEPNSAEPDLQKKKSRFRLHGRSRSKSLARPEVNLPREQDTPTVAETVPQFAEVMRAKEVNITAEKSPRQRSASRPRFYAEFSVKEYANAYPPIERVNDQRWSPRMARDSTEDIKGYKRAQSLPRGVTPADRRQSSAGERTISKTETARKEDAARRQRSRSVAASAHRAMKDDADDELTAIPKTPKNKIIGQAAAATPQETQSEPKKAQEPPRKERRNTFERIFSRESSKERTSRSGSRSDSRSPKLPDVNSPAYIASRFSSPPPDPNRMASSQPRTIPWEANNTPSKPRSGQATPFVGQGKFAVSRNDSAVSASSVHAPVGKHTKPATAARQNAPLTTISTNVQTATDHDCDGAYRAYRASDAVSITKLTSPTKETPRLLQPPPPTRPAPSKPHHQTPTRQDRLSLAVSSPHQAQPDREKRWSHASAGDSAQHTPESLFDRFGGGLDYGWDRGQGFTGSAGTRSGASERAHRKSVVLSESFGVDLSDVPVFVRRV